MQSENVPKWLQSSAGRYAVAAAAVGAVVLVKLGLRRFLGDDAIFPLFYAAVLISAWFGGLRAGLLATGLVLFATHLYFVDYANDPPAANILRYLGFGFEGILISLVIGALHAANRKARASAAELQTERYRLLETAHEGICTLDAEHRIEYVNRRLCEMLGCSAHEILGKPLYDFIADDKQETARKALTAQAVGMDQSWDLSLRQQSSAELFTRVSTSPILRDGKIVGCLAMITDVTERTKAERALRRSDEQSRLLTEVLPQIVWTCTPSGQPEYFNQKWYAYSGLGEDNSFNTQGWLQIVHREDLASCTERWEAALRAGETYEVECRFRRADGAFRWHLVRVLPLPSADGGIVRWIGSGTDIDDHKRLAAERGEWEVAGG